MMDRSYWYCGDLSGSSSHDKKEEERYQVTTADNANLVGSLLPNGKHAPVLDIDVSHKLVPSSTEGHSHLYFDVEVEWDDYVELLNVMAKCGILEPGYVSASIRRGSTFVRKPGVRKDNEYE